MAPKFKKVVGVVATVGTVAAGATALIKSYGSEGLRKLTDRRKSKAGDQSVKMVPRTDDDYENDGKSGGADKA